MNVNKRLLNGGMEKLVKTSSIKYLINYFLFFFWYEYTIFYCLLRYESFCSIVFLHLSGSLIIISSFWGLFTKYSSRCVFYSAYVSDFR